MEPNKIVSRENWIAARERHLAKEKEFTKARDALSADRRALPWVKVDKDYVFEGPDGKESLADLFEGRGQLIVYHFMYGPDWEEGCPSCSLLADHFDGANWHLGHRDVTLVAASRAPLEKLDAYKARMDWRFKWVSSLGSDFNYDYNVTLDEADVASGKTYYNYGINPYPATEAHGLSVFRKGDNGDVFHTYSSYARGLDMLIGAYNWLDLVPKGRDEADLGFTMEWIRRHDSYGE